jgi:hypothetical protein
MVFLTIAVSAKVWLYRSAPAAELPAVTSTEAAQPTESTVLPSDDPERTDVEIITLLPTGFEPKEINRPKGQFLLVVHDRSGADDVNFRLNREAGNRLHDVRVEEGMLSWRTPLDLHPGAYVLTEAGHPEWSCRINVTAR